MIPILYADWIFGFTAGLVTTLSAVLISIPRTFFFSPVTTDAILETVAMALVGIVICFLIWSKNKEKTRADNVVVELEKTRRILQNNIEGLTISEKRLGMLNAISATLYGSLELKGVFEKAVHLVSELMSSELTLLFISEETLGNWI